MRRSAAAAPAVLAVLLGGCSAFAPPPSPAALDDPEAAAAPSVRLGAIGDTITIGDLSVTVLAAGEWPSGDQTLGPDLRGVSLHIRLSNRGEAVVLEDDAFQLVDDRTAIRYAATSRRDAGDIALPIRLASGDTVEGLLSFTPPRDRVLTFRFAHGASGVGETKLGRISRRLAETDPTAAPEVAGLPLPAPSTAPSGPCLRITGGEWDPAGADATPSVLAQEYVKVRNLCTRTVPLRGWTLYDARRENVYAFAQDLRVGPGKTIRLYSGTGTDSGLTLYWDRRKEVWANSAPERAFLADPSGDVISTWSPYP